MKLELEGHIDFYDQNEVAVMTENTVTDKLEALQLELGLFSWFSLRTLSLIKGEFREALRALLYEFSLPDDFQELLDRYELELVKPKHAKGKKGFNPRINLLSNGFTTRNRHYGFGILGKGTNYYAPMSVLAVGCYLANKHKKDKIFLNQLRFAAERIADWTNNKRVSVRDEQGLTLALLKDLKAKYK